jgi:hypothetical protein
MPPQDLFALVEAARPLAKTFGVPAASPTPDRRIAGDTPANRTGSSRGEPATTDGCHTI